MTKQISVGVIGLGYWGPNLMRNYNALGALGAICDASPDALRAAAAKYPGTRAFERVGDLLKDPEIDAVVIATPAATHGALVREALASGKHVFVEKPLCLDVNEAESLKDEAERAGRRLMVGHLLHYHPAFQSLRNLIASGALGRIRYIYSNRLSLGKIRREENSLWSFAPHDISMILALTGNMPLEVTGNASGHLTPGIADTTLTHMRFPDNINAHIFVSWLHPYKEHRLVVVGEDAMAVFNDAVQGPEKLLLYRHQVGWEGDLPVVQKAEATPISYADTEPLRGECEAFLDAIANNTVPPSDAAEGIRVLRVLDACRRAIESGQPIHLTGTGRA